MNLYQVDKESSTFTIWKCWKGCVKKLDGNDPNFLPTGQIINQVYYLEVLEMLREKVRRKRPEMFANNLWILHHDKAPAHTALPVREFLATKQITVGTPCLFTGSSPQ